MDIGIIESAGVAAAQRHRIREKMSSIFLEHDPSAAVKDLPSASSSRRHWDSNSKPNVDGGRLNRQGAGMVTTDAVQPKTVPFPSPGEANFLGMVGMTQTIVEVESEEEISPRHSIVNNETIEDSKRPPPPFLSQRLRPISTSASKQRGTIRHVSDDGTDDSGSNRSKNLGDIYDSQLDHRAKSSKKRRLPHTAFPTARNKRIRNQRCSESSHVKRCLYEHDDGDVISYS